MNVRPAVALALVSLALAACAAQPPANQGRSGGRLDPTHDSPYESGVRDLRSADLVAATDRMAASIADRLDVATRDAPPRIIVGRIENRTSCPEQNYQVFLDRLRAVLLSSSARHGLDMRRERDFVQTQRAREYGVDDPERGPGAFRSEAEYVLTAIVSDLPAGGTDYFMIEYQLVQLVDRALTGPDTGPGAIVWAGMYEVKYQ